MKYVIANWKSNPQTEEDAVNLISDLERKLDGLSGVEVVVCPPFLYLVSVKAVLRNSKLGAQTVSAHAGGAFTGDISAKQLADLKVQYVIVGHSERRSSETDEGLRLELTMADSENITPIYCVGSGLRPEDSDAKIRTVIRKQLDLLHGLNLKKLLIAYEPTWGISTSGSHKTPTFSHVKEMCDFIKKNVDHVSNLAVLYGGSVDKTNVSEFTGVDGFLVGGASLDADEFADVVKGAI